MIRSLVWLTGVLVVATATIGAQEKKLDREAIVHALSRLSYGPTAELVAEVEAKGYEAWLDEQLAARAPAAETAAVLARAATTCWCRGAGGGRARAGDDPAGAVGGA